jgi:hypothetical protein
MAATPNQAPQAPEFPFWPYNCLSLYAHMARDFGRYTQAVTKSTDAMQTARAEGDFGVRLFADLMQGYFDLALTPWTAMASVMAERAVDAQEAPAAEVRPIKARGRAG